MGLPEITPDDTIIALMGMTGVGKSSFISLFTNETVPIGTDLESCTEICSIYPATIPGTSKKFWLVDTPGFDDSRKTDYEILRELSSWLVKSYQEHIRLKGIVYLHRILDVRLGGTSMRNLRMFKKLVGEENLSSIVLATTFWEQTDPNAGERRENQLRVNEEFWGKMVASGSRMFRHNQGVYSGTQILNYLLGLEGKPKYDIQVDMVDKKKGLDQTAAGAEVQSQVDKLRQEYEKRLDDYKKEMEQAIKDQDIASQNEILELRKAHEDWLANQEDERKKAQAKADELWRQRETEREIARDQYHEQLLELTRLYTQTVQQATANQANRQLELELEIMEQRMEILRLKEKADRKKCVVM
ncbi:hypothetical protein LTR47_008696 [Exophiala xenobiotica]|nr:hypothetical protein LTR47_008696 [Exophiala xenobiotica]KAK5241941.1 hypothetical protein LTS06_011828 [Exophiala xenobiotica]KAK5280797.1 hypothetical protein LTR40_005831 [Exophiala xenobiotica]KAK5315809.1 hypothetical protein LTR93_009670 [Exophiala xenobiotica]KAK5346483.1 hypothetical protein LTR61_009684 [Exophiala xenobiotica]